MNLRKVVVAPDSFKGSLSAQEAAEFIKLGVTYVFPESEVISFPLSDGGEGFINVLCKQSDFSEILLEVNGPFMKTRQAKYLYNDKERKAVIESAEACGIYNEDAASLNPMIATSYGLGEIINNAVGRGVREIIIGLGGSCTNDGGMGMLRALCFRFYDSFGHELSGRGKDLGKLTKIEAPSDLEDLKKIKFTVACDVRNPLLGDKGCARIFAPQKGADPQMVFELEEGMTNYAIQIEKFSGKNLKDTQGAGAAGGLGFALMNIFDARFISGVELILKLKKFEEELKNCDLVITGEGSLDLQTLMGKVPVAVLGACLSYKIPVIALGGNVKDIEKLNEIGFSSIFSINSYQAELSELMDNEIASRNLFQTVVQIMKTIRCF